MKISISNIVIAGNLTKDVEVREVSGKKVANFTVAVSRPYKNDEGNYESDFYDCQVWGGQAEYMARGKKGDVAWAVGRHEARNWTDKNGQKRRDWRVNAVNCGIGIETMGGAAAAPAADAAPAAPSGGNEEWPF